MQLRLFPSGLCVCAMCGCQMLTPTMGRNSTKIEFVVLNHLPHYNSGTVDLPVWEVYLYFHLYFCLCLYASSIYVSNQPHLTLKCCLITCYFINHNCHKILTLSLTE